GGLPRGYQFEHRVDDAPGVRAAVAEVAQEDDGGGGPQGVSAQPGQQGVEQVPLAVQIADRDDGVGYGGRQLHGRLPSFLPGYRGRRSHAHAAGSSLATLESEPRTS